MVVGNPIWFDFGFWQDIYILWVCFYTYIGNSYNSNCSCRRVCLFLYSRTRAYADQLHVHIQQYSWLVCTYTATFLIGLYMDNISISVNMILHICSLIQINVLYLETIQDMLVYAKRVYSTGMFCFDFCNVCGNRRMDIPGTLAIVGTRQDEDNKSNQQPIYKQHGLHRIPRRTCVLADDMQFLLLIRRHPPW